MTSRKDFLELFLISFAALFLELAVIRWLSTEIRIFAYFKNLALMAAFLGFGVGCSFHARWPTLFYRWFPRLLTCLVCVIALAPLMGITHVIFVDPRQYFLLGSGFGDHALRSAPSLYKTAKALFVIIAVFFLTMATFAALCSMLGEVMNRLKPLPAYSVNVLGSLAGIVAFSLVSFLELQPTVWLLIAYGVLAYFFVRTAALRLFLLYSVAALAVTAAMQVKSPALWSPYYKITARVFGKGPIAGVRIAVNHDGFQVIQQFGSDYRSLLREADVRAYHRHYDIPFRLARRKIESVLILGGGGGNDASVALRNGVSHIDVVEIDPVIARLGHELNLDRPYASSAVHLFIDDARSFLQKTPRTYDLVIFATLDSHTAFSSLSSLRLDNFVFTRESLKAVREKLRPGGGVAINFFAVNAWLSQRHLDTLREALGTEPFALGSRSNQEVLLLAGELFDRNRDPGETDYAPIATPFTSGTVEPVSDDWPFLFLETRGIPFHYLLPLFLIFVLSLIPFRYSLRAAGRVDWHLFFMGAAFLLIETKAVTALGLLMGSTWLVNALVIGAILLVILAANGIASAGVALSFTGLYLALASALAINLFFPFDMLNRLAWGLRLGAGAAITASPIFVAALIFAKAFATVPSPSAALASNLFGALVGGLLEYLDMWTGLRWLNLIALVLYGLSYVSLWRRSEGLRAVPSFDRTVPS
ncbi:MAG TPA: hypothetical protein VNN77_15765 [candidate division Zixibacteria bacterium]|nr:hypothetical protein [candidate division Zixibacteria bacterium]